MEMLEYPEFPTFDLLILWGKNDLLFCVSQCCLGFCSMRPTQFLNDAEHVSAYIRALSSMCLWQGVD